MCKKSRISHTNELRLTEMWALFYFRPLVGLIGFDRPIGKRGGVYRLMPRYRFLIDSPDPEIGVYRFVDELPDDDAAVELCDGFSPAYAGWVLVGSLQDRWQFDDE